MCGEYLLKSLFTIFILHIKRRPPQHSCAEACPRGLSTSCFSFYFGSGFSALSLSLDICIYLFKRRIILPVASGSRRTYLRPRLRPIEAAVAKANEPAACGISAKWTRPRWPKITTTRARLEYIYCMAFGAAC